LNAARMLGWMGLYRRRSTLGSLALIGAGALAGAGIAMFVSPRSGRDTRQGVVRGVQRLRRKGSEILRSAREEVRELAESGDGGKEGQEARKGEHRGEERQAGISGGARQPGEAGGRPGGVNITQTR
jgi:gas vesicle protein